MNRAAMVVGAVLSGCVSMCWASEKVQGASGARGASFGWFLISVTSVLALILVVNWIIKRINAKGEKTEVKNGVNMLHEMYVTVLHSYDQLLFDQLHEAVALPDILKPKAEEILSRLMEARSKVAAKKEALENSQFPPPANTREISIRLQADYAESAKLAASISQLNAELERKTAECMSRATTYLAAMESIQAQGDAMQKEGYPVSFKRLDDFKKELAKTKRLVTEKKVHPDSVDWQQLAATHDLVCKEILTPRVKHDEAALEISRCKTAHDSVGRERVRASAILQEIKGRHPQAVWEDVGSRFEKIEEFSLLFKRLLEAAESLNVIGLGTYAEALDQVEEAKSQLEVMRSICRDVKKLSDELDRISSDHQALLAKAREALESAQRTAEEAADLPAIRKARDLASQFTEAENAMLRSEQGEMIDWIGFAREVDEIIASCAEVTAPAK